MNIKLITTLRQYIERRKADGKNSALMRAATPKYFFDGITDDLERIIKEQPSEADTLKVIEKVIISHDGQLGGTDASLTARAIMNALRDA